MQKRRSLEAVDLSSITIAFILENVFLNDDLTLSFNAGKCFLKQPAGI